ncbi:MAG: efflux RND transporter periplasmic adaptor subunit [candidate division KSB1 bacterium]|nr:efflux RND transporter periplasmic adaptor subunit [candidate division KSB1 bacterium]MDZ7310641.1 efflux RND transporter periplasmic adaptor subunit [candidate division KSB1 bacterium]
MKRKPLIFSVLLVLVLVGGYLLWPRKSAEKNVMNGIPLRTATITRGDLTVLVSANGKVEPIRKVEVKSKASGQILMMPVEEGDRVKKGDLIARIDETDLRNAYEQAVADLEVAKATVAQTTSNVSRQMELFKRGLLSQAEIDQVKLEEVRAKAQLVKAETELTTMETKLKDAVVRAPISGIILQKNVEVGQIISSGISSVTGGTLIATVANMDSVFIYAQVDEVDIGQVHIGQKAKVVADAFPDDVFYGSVLRIAPLATVEQNVTTFNVTVVVQNTDNKLKAGMNTTVDLTVIDRHDVLLVPKEALKDFSEIRTQLIALYGADSSLAGRPGGPRQIPDSVRARWRERMANNAGPGAPAGMFGGMMGRRGNGEPGDGQPQRKFVLVKKDDRYVPRRIETGVSNYDFAEVTNGLEDGETVLIFSSSRAAADRQRMMDRMRSMSGFSGFSGSGQRQTSGSR